MDCYNEKCLDLSTEYKTDRLFDTFVVAEDGFVFKAHKLLLSEGSEFFKCFFEFSFYYRKENIEFISINLQFSSSTLATVLRFLYSGTLHLNKDNIYDLAEAADYLLIDDLLMKCSNYMQENISLDNCIFLLNLSYFYERLHLKKRCIRFVAVNFNNILLERNSDINKLPFVFFQDLIKKHYLKVIDQYDLWKAIVSWIESDHSKRLKDLPELLPCIRWNELSPQEKSVIAVHPIFKEMELCRDVQLEQLIRTSENEYTHSKGRYPTKFHFFSCERASKRKFSSTYSVSGGGRVTDIYMTYDEEMNMCRKITETTQGVAFLTAAGQYIFTFDSSKGVRAYDLVKKEWISKSPMSEIHDTLRDAYFIQCKKFIFAVPPGHWSTIQYYDLSTSKWLNSAALSLLNITAATVLRDKLCIVGHSQYRGPSGTESPRMKALVYDTARKVWSNIGTPQQFIRSFALINFRESLYILGGKTLKFEVTRRVEVYRPDIDEWVEFASLPFLYQKPRAVVIKDKLIVYEARYSIGIDKSPPCSWNEKTEKWDVLDFSPYNSIDKYKFCFLDEESVLKTLSKQSKDSRTIWDKTINWD